jgi:hypothetical protein
MEEDFPVLDVSDQLNRQALWAAHDKRCCYCREPLRFAHLEIDHVVPANLRSKPEELAKCLRELELPHDYNLNCVDNLLPAHGNCNREKSGKLYGESSLRFFREVAGKGARKFSNLRERLSQQSTAETDIAKVVNHISTGAASLEQFVDVATNRKPFDSREDLQCDDFVRMSEPCVRIECQLPTEAKPSGRASIIFHSLNLRGTQIEVDHGTLTRELFRGLRAPVNPRWRRFLKKPWKTKPIHYLQIGSVSFQLELEEATQFCRLLDRLYPIYANAFHHAEVAFAGLESPLKSPGSYEIASVPMALWQQMEAFVRLHDLANGNSEWHIFDAPAWVWLKVIRRTPTWWDYQCFMDVVVGRPMADARALPRSRVSLRWVSSSNHPSGDRHGTGWCWSVKECEAFMFDRLIPKVVSSNWLKEPIIASQMQDMNVFRMSGYEQVTAADFTSPAKAVFAFERIQPLYSGQHDQFIDSKVVASIFQFLNLLLEHHQLPSYSVDYMGPNLRCGGAKSKSELIVQTNSLLGLARRGGSAKAEPVTTGTTVDYASRCVLEVLHKGEANNVVNREWASWMKLLESVIKDYNERNYLRRMRAEDFNDD